MIHDANLDRKLLAAVDRLGRALRAARQSVATRHELSQLGVSLIETLADGRVRRIGDLAAELAVSQPTVSDALAVLDRRGLIARVRDPLDMRSTLITLTDMGSAVGDEIASELGPIAEAQTGSTAERGIALRVLLGEIARLQKAGIITVNRSCLTCHHYQPPDGHTSGRCLLLDTELGDADLRVDCPDHEALAS